VRALGFGSGIALGLLLAAGTALASTPLDQIVPNRGVRFNGNGTDQFGAAVAGLGDINGDGFSDLAVGAPAGGTGQRGVVHVFFGSAVPVNLASTALNGMNGFTLTGTGLPANTGLGLEVAAAGDVNDDGVNDLLVGSNANIAPQSAATAAWVLYGRLTAWPATLDVSALTGAALAHWVGKEISTATRSPICCWAHRGGRAAGAPTCCSGATRRSRQPWRCRPSPPAPGW
jgi:hypothetical protein